MPTAATAPAVSVATRPGYRLGTIGSWGQLQTTRIVLEPPEDYIPPYFTTAQPLRWTFRGYTPATLDALWKEAALSPAEVAVFNEPAHRSVEAGTIILSPPAATVLGLSPSARARIYAALAQFPENPPQFSPFRSRSELVDEWFNDSIIPPDIVALTRRLLYPRGPNLMLSDQDLVLPRMPDASHRIAYIKTLSRKSSLLAELLVPHGANVDGLARFWGQGRRSKDIASILESLAQRPQGGSIDVIHLLPPFARSLLYTYPKVDQERSGVLRDCHWTSFNFFREQPDDRFTDLSFVQQTILRDYFLCSPPYQLGDIVMLVGKGEQGVHSCVYVADKVYTLGDPLELRTFRAR
ncbi:MAG: hypothetical protein HZC55_09995 [Verrucomicrobia bacterium]|nr:hypothetical protein [Verrucomicrobiota bacterium]